MLKKTLLSLLAIGAYCMPLESSYAEGEVKKALSEDSTCLNGVSICTYENDKLKESQGPGCPQTLSDFANKYPQKGSKSGGYTNCSD